MADPITTREGFKSVFHTEKGDDFVDVVFDNQDNIEGLEEDGMTIKNGNSITFEDVNGNAQGDISASEEALEIQGRSDTGETPVRIKGTTAIIQAEQLAIQFQGAQVGNFPQLIGEYDLDGDKVYTIGTTPLDVAAYSETFTNSSDVAITTSNSLVVSGVLANAYSAGFSQGSTQFRVENDTTSDATIEVWITADGAVPDPGDIFVFVIPRKTGSTPGVNIIGFNDTTDGALTATQTLQLFAKVTAGTSVTAKGTVLTSILRIQENTDLGAMYFEAVQIKNAKSATPVTSIPKATDLMIYIDPDTNETKIGKIRDIVGATALTGVVSGSGASIVASETPTALAIFDTLEDSTGSTIVKTSGDTGLTLNAPLVYDVECNVSFEAVGNTDFNFQIYVGGVGLGRVVQASGDGPGKSRNFTVRTVTPVSIPLDEVELRVSNSGDTLTSISSSMFIRFWKVS